ncbi:MAG: hypothetical protein M1831_003771 [Alyxoria varia]|nr:MAG: hypothetical protein M1831_003771 [Alyxoria varia]
MPPRIDLHACSLSHHTAQHSLCNALSQLRISGHPPSNALRPLKTSRPSSTSTVAQKRRKHQDPYALAQARARKAANLSRQETLQVERAKTLGDPVRGVTTPFIASLDTGRPPNEQPKEEGDQHLNHFVNPKLLQSSLEQSRRLTTPTYASPDRVKEEKKISDSEIHNIRHANAVEAIRRITNIDNGSAEDRTRVNIQRCIDTFGRHVTDTQLKGRPDAHWQKKKAQAAASTVGIQPGKDGQFRPPATNPPESSDQLAQAPLMERVGPDTGSSEVQIAILTAKIRSLANFLESRRGRKDKVNKRNLRLLVHRRQKLLRYLKKKERGGERFRYLMDTLGLTEGTYKGEISL